MAAKPMDINMGTIDTRAYLRLEGNRSVEGERTSYLGRCYVSTWVTKSFVHQTPATRNLLM